MISFKSLKFWDFNDGILKIDGLTNYWSIWFDTKDLFGQSHMTLEAESTLSSDRLQNPNSSLFLNSSFATVSSGVYFNGDFTIIGWVKVNQIQSFSRFLDFGNGKRSNNVVLGLSKSLSGKPFLQILQGNQSVMLTSTVGLEVGKWKFITAILKGNSSYFYINAIMTAFTESMQVPLNIMRSKCYFGKSNWNDSNADANFDEIMIFNKSLTESQLRDLMTRTATYKIHEN